MAFSPPRPRVTEHDPYPLSFLRSSTNHESRACSHPFRSPQPPRSRPLISFGTGAAGYSGEYGCLVFSIMRTSTIRAMPRISVIFYQEDSSTVPVLDWLDRLSARAQDKCRVRIERLRDLGHELRRPEADYLRDGIYELRVGLQGMNYRMLYFFHGRVAAVLFMVSSRKGKCRHGILKRRFEES
jgi:hypothetical protein